MVNQGFRIVLGVVVLGFGAWAQEPAQEVARAIRAGLAHHEKGDSAAAIQSLQQAIDLIQRQQQAGVERFLPKALPGWTAEDLERESFAGGSAGAQAAFFRVARSFTRGDGEFRMTVSLQNWPEAIVPQREMLNALKGNPMVLQAMNQGTTAKTSFIERDGWNGWKRLDREGNEVEVLLMAEAWMLQITGNTVDEKAIEALLGAVDLKGIAAAK
ncbi:MAG: hypothetical protein GX595_13895 [Lentisphaerae bacterium]|nr:hypothetical protein [Lentisphaerota bacterium]